MLSKRVFLRSFVALAAVGALAGNLLAPGEARAQEEENYLLATASTGGTYYPVGVALATLVKVKLQPKDKIGMSAINSAGSGENIKLLRDNEVQFAILQGLYGAYAKNGTGPLESEGPQEGLRSITMLWPNVEHFVVMNDLVDSGNVSDVENAKGEAVNLGAQNSGTLGSNRTILGNLGYDIENDFDLVYSGYSAAAEALQNGQIVMMSTPAGPPVGAVTQAFANMGDQITVLDFTDEQVSQANGDFGELWTRFTIPAGTYPGQEKDINTIGQPNFLAVRDDVPEETIYKITKTIYENLAFLQGIHPATNNMKLEAAIAGLPLPLHPGAARYYEEQGITIPDRLKMSMQ
ncbi:TAXI family TRAP transporter solute-binding subunit [Afifella pfennigii]|uniref:TAXI family TRAP transporter solute-binding subunit n=1 Tax=Afifella pfennigii TaxID=209897 RepID=UPI00047B8EB3|nr:TAXI family TRAP transporter solute-binding subunit [Afifella pfennigii]